MRAGRLHPAAATASATAATTSTATAVVRAAVVTAGVTVAAILLAACNDEASVNKNPHTGVATASPVNGVQQLTVTTGNDYRFHPSTLTVHPGKVRVILENTARPGAGPPHNLQVIGLPAADVPLVAAGQSAAVVFVAPAPGRYRLVCSIHVAQGQTGTLVVLPK